MVTELPGMLDKNLSQVVLRPGISVDANIIGSRFILSIQDLGTQQERFKARPVVQGHTGLEKAFLFHISNAIRPQFIRLLLCLAAIFGFCIWSHDMTQASLQSAHQLQRQVYVEPVDELNINADELVKLLNPVYVLPDAVYYWHDTFHAHLGTDLKIISTNGDHSFFARHTKLSGITGTQVDDTISAGSPKFENESQQTEQQFHLSKFIYDNFKFSGNEIETTDRGFLIHQERNFRQLKPLKCNSSFEQFRSTCTSVLRVCPRGQILSQPPQYLHKLHPTCSPNITSNLWTPSSTMQDNIPNEDLYNKTLTLKLYTYSFIVFLLLPTSLVTTLNSCFLFFSRTNTVNSILSTS